MLSKVRAQYKRKTFSNKFRAYSRKRGHTCVTTKEGCKLQ